MTTQEHLRHIVKVDGWTALIGDLADIALEDAINLENVKLWGESKEAYHLGRLLLSAKAEAIGCIHYRG
jgi:hypothetical protein